MKKPNPVALIHCQARPETVSGHRNKCPLLSFATLHVFPQELVSSSSFYFLYTEQAHCHQVKTHTHATDRAAYPDTSLLRAEGSPQPHGGGSRCCPRSEPAPPSAGRGRAEPPPRGATGRRMSTQRCSQRSPPPRLPAGGSSPPGHRIPPPRDVPLC